MHLLEVDKTGKSQGFYSRLSIAGTIARHYAILAHRENALTWLEEAARRRDDGQLQCGRCGTGSRSRTTRGSRR
ncbi:MAG: hypothetical protein ACRD2A_02720 [Vicinamibacterales bacterium]